ncbi:MAG: glutamine-synthetase adenylyltransferase, partial [Croceibacterium sp.]
RSLDFTAIEEIRRLTARIRLSYSGPVEPGPGFDLKHGRGGIREIEFFAHTHQLIYGGRNPALRLRGTRAALDALAEGGFIAGEDAAYLGAAYDRLRTTEHRLQMVDDRQTHALPAAAALDGVARLDGFADGDALVGELRELCGAVAARYDRLLAAQGQPASVATLALDAYGARIDQWRDTIPALRGPEARAAFGAILPDLVTALRQASDPDHALARWETLLARLPSAVNLLRLFEQRPGLLDQVLRVLTLAPPLADELARHPALLDRLIDASALDLPGSVGELSARMAATEAGDSYEFQLDRIRRVVSEERFALGVQLIDNRHEPLAIASGLSRVAEAALATAAAAAIGEFEAVHGRVAGGELIVLGLGRLGGAALTHASDLDLIYLFSGAIGVDSDGRRPLTASLYFNRLAQRVTAALSVPTASGALYQVDTRLRPQGSSGPLAVSLESFARYQHDDAWTWEHMALARARPVFGSAPTRDALALTVREVLSAPRDGARLRADVMTMRAEIAQHKPPAGSLDAKLLRGGLVDVEFIVHFLQLRDGVALEPAVATALAALAGAGLVPSELPGHYRLLARLLIAGRLLAPDSLAPAPAACAALAAACRAPDYPTLLRALREARQGVAKAWAQVFGETVEIEQ